AHYEAFHVEVGADFIKQLLTIALIVPGVLLPGVQTERRSAKQRPGWILADEIVLRAVTQFDRAVLNVVEDLESRHDVTSGEDLNLEFAIGRLGNVLRQVHTGTEQRIERLRPARSQAPPQLRHGLGNRGRSNCGSCQPDAGGLQKLTTFHKTILPDG